MIRGLLTLAIVAAITLPAGAQSVDADLLTPAAEPHAILGVRTARILPHLDLHAGLSLGWINDSAIGRRDQATIRLLHDRVGAELSLGVGLFDWVSLHAALPLHLTQTTQSYPVAGQDQSGGGLGDLRFEARVRLVGGQAAGGIGLALGAELTVPSSSDRQLMGEEGVTVTPRLVVDYRLPGRFVAALNIGWTIRDEHFIEDLVLDDALVLGLGVEVPLRVLDLSLLLETDLEVGFPNGDRATAHTPVEALAGLRWRPASGWIVTGATGVGLTGGFGAPDARILLQLGWTSSSKAPARGTDPDMGVDAAEPIAAAASTRPQPALPVWPTRIPPELFDTLKDQDPDGDGIATAMDRCPQLAEDPDGFEDGDGCPDHDNDHDGIPDKADQCPLDRETANGVADDDGCPDEGVGRVQIGRDTLSLGDKIYFETGSDQLQSRSTSLLREVAAVLRSTPWIKRVRIEGHTDDSGDVEMNVDLSERRARSVMMFMTDHGVDSERLSARGYGPTQPARKGKSKAARRANRRVEFRLLEVDRPPSAAPEGKETP
ncbi:MAG: outer membrane protein OmpA-like peptidoglycan-associated protein [Myxococcota bacterium]|jgi:outer membrane protein OmpA-like peptidoglycan-associated protein